MVIEKSLKYRIITENKNLENFKTINLKISDKKGMYIIHRALVQQLNCKRKKTVSTKTRSEVRGGGRKPWKQKGTGRARAGSNRSPLWRGGGVIFGPKNQNYKIKINKKEKKLALRTIIYNKFKQTFVTDNLNPILDKPNTQLILQKLTNLGISITKNSKILIITTNQDPNLYLSIRNLQNVDLINASQMNLFKILKAKQIIITTNALDTINKIYNQ
uniref:Large ribosomal subunit protein uL4c n=1 Tax=Leiomenia cribrosa TaxID=217483 RepID=A0A4D6WUR9_9FLOR|nr:ribosomal protein L4 [Leiomenia cribrosa]